MEIESDALGPSSALADDWRKALNRVVSAVVVIKSTVTRAFDTESAGSIHATGFIVDKSLGIILTNRHVVKPGPVVAEAMFLNREEIPIYPLYRDPVHDFGFFRFDPVSVQFMQYEEIPLVPEAATVGLEIRVVGNDSGEKISILAGTLARLDRDAPHYKKDAYNDFNTFYMQAASGTKGGSSGSPVIDCHGRAVALNAGSKTSSASAFFLPLERVVRALSCLQKSRDKTTESWNAIDIKRGTLQMTLMHKGFDETRRLGLKHETEQMVRQASPAAETGMLVVESVVPGGPAHKHLEPGDVLVRVNGEVITQFLRLETLLDDNVGANVVFEVERGGQPRECTLRVQDLHLITPDFFLEVSGGVIHPLSYQQARNFRFECGLVYVAEPGYMLSRAGVPRHAIIKKLAGEEVSNVEGFLSILLKLSKGARVPLEYNTYTDRYRSKSVLVTMDRHEWYAMPQWYKRNDAYGVWKIEPAVQIENSPSAPLDSAKVITQPNRIAEGENEAFITDSPVGSDSKDRESGSIDTGSLEALALESDQLGVDTLKRGECKRRRVLDKNAEQSIVMSDCKGEPMEPTLTGNLPDNRGEGVNDVALSTGSGASVAENILEASFAMFEVHIPPSTMLDGVQTQHSLGTGIVVHHSENLGLVAVDRNTVAIAVSDVMLSFAAYPVEIPAEVVFLHPVHNYALVAYNPESLGSAGVAAIRAAVLLSEPPIQRGESVHLAGLSRSLQVILRKSIVTDPGAALNIGYTEYPRYRAMNMEVIELDTDFGHSFSGVLSDEFGRVKALWARFSTQVKYGDTPAEDMQFTRGIPIHAICEVLDKILKGNSGPSLLINGTKRNMPTVRVLEAELYPTLLSKARSFGLSDSWVQALAKKDPVRRQVLRVKGCLAGSKAEKVLEQGDMLLAIDGHPITCFQDVDYACNLMTENDNNGRLKLTVFRQGMELEVFVGLDVRNGFGTTRMVNWAGGIIQNSHPAVRALGFLPEEGHGVYINRWSHGSPAHRYGLYALQWIVEINGKSTPDLDTFVEVTKELDHGTFVRVKTVYLNGKPRVLTMKQDLHYWPTWELCFDPETATWRRKIIKAHIP
ncbi:hypothetical protein GOP47_0010785 [Adiantum capillus-veneris]|uniref:Pro-apoptotic serine protease NMA111 n=1 Tax=Adiantum capillus-veneris TaxID=13818 RepID=A0A9D4UVK5_ADICA|nr:hypothetical protein GOP47_0010785 [Adiantum capillus-veneris]